MAPPTAAQYSVIDSMINATYSQYSATAAGQVPVRYHIVKVLEEQIKIIDSNLSLEVIGSTGSGLSLVSSDINININIGDPCNEVMCEL